MITTDHLTCDAAAIRPVSGLRRFCTRLGLAWELLTKGPKLPYDDAEPDWDHIERVDDFACRLRHVDNDVLADMMLGLHAALDPSSRVAAVVAEARRRLPAWNEVPSVINARISTLDSSADSYLYSIAGRAMTTEMAERMDRVLALKRAQFRNADPRHLRVARDPGGDS